MYIGSWDDSDTITFSVLTKGANGAVADSDAVPAYRIYEDETATPIHTGNMAKLDDDNTLGLYSERLQISLVKGKSYSIYISYAISSVAYGELHNIQMSAAADLRHIEGDATSDYNANLKLKSIMVVNDNGDAAYFQSQGGNGNGLVLGGNGTGHGFFSAGGDDDGHGAYLYGGGSSGDGLHTTGGSGTGDGCGIKAIGLGNGDGISAEGTLGGAGMRIEGGAVSDAGLLCFAGTDSDGIGAEFRGDGNGSGMTITCLGLQGVALWLSDATNTVNVKYLLEHVALKEDVIPELSAGEPSDTPTLSEVLSFLYMQQKNKITTTATLQTLYAANGTTPICKNTLDDNGVTFTRSKSVAP
jgi:hypothetical protein